MYIHDCTILFDIYILFDINILIFLFHFQVKLILTYLDLISMVTRVTLVVSIHIPLPTLQQHKVTGFLKSLLESIIIIIIFWFKWAKFIHPTVSDWSHPSIY